jgi:hypothetical protein
MRNYLTRKINKNETCVSAYFSNAKYFKILCGRSMPYEVDGKKCRKAIFVNPNVHTKEKSFENNIPPS